MKLIEVSESAMMIFITTDNPFPNFKMCLIKNCSFRKFKKVVILC